MMAIYYKRNTKKRKELGSKLIFNPDKHVSNLINAIKKSIKRSENKVNDKKKNPTEPNAPDADDEDNNNSDDESISDSENTSENWFRDNQSLIIITGIGLLTILYLYYSQEEPNYYDF